MRYLRVYEWTDQKNGRRFAGVLPMVVVNLFHDENEAQFETAVQDLSSRRQGERVLMPFWLLTRELRQHIPELPDRPDLDWLTVFENGIETGPTIEWLRPLGERLRQRGLWLDLIAADVEDGVTTWDILPAWDPDAWEQALSRIYDSAAAFQRLPQDLKQLRPRDYNPWTDDGRQAIARFNYYARWLVVEAFQKIFVESRIFDDARGRRRFRMCNWCDVRPTFPVRDANGWPMTPLATDTVSAWSAYLSEPGGLFESSNHERIWTAFVHQMNLVRSCAAMRGGSLTPWISSPRYFVRKRKDGSFEQGYDMRNVWLWRELVAHLVRAGVREFLMWNADPEPELARRLVAEGMRAHDKPYSRRALEELPLDVDEVTTRGYTTKYSDFLAEYR